LGAHITNYYMVDAAVAIEAYDGGAAQDPLMAPEDWYQAIRSADQNYAERLWASEWYLNHAFAAGDARKTLTWRNRLQGVTQATVYNFYSSGEEVLASPDPTTPSQIGAVGGILYNAVFTDNPQGERVWTLQEKLKGRALSGEILGSTYGGWKFNHYWDVTLEPGFTRRRTPAEANTLTDAQLISDPFYFYGPSDLHNSNGSAYAAQTWKHPVWQI